MVVSNIFFLLVRIMGGRPDNGELDIPPPELLGFLRCPPSPDGRENPDVSGIS
jgi:hypothetical protein